jgi:hypothetical protein
VVLVGGRLEGTGVLNSGRRHQWLGSTVAHPSSSTAFGEVGSLKLSLAPRTLLASLEGVLSLLASAREAGRRGESILSPTAEDRPDLPFEVNVEADLRQDLAVVLAGGSDSE